MTVFFELCDRIDDYLAIMAFLQYYFKNNIKVVSLNHSISKEKRLLNIFEACKVPKPNLYVDNHTNIPFAVSVNDSVFKGDLYVMCDINLLEKYRIDIKNNLCNVYYFSDFDVIPKQKYEINNNGNKIIKKFSNLTLIPRSAASNFTLDNITLKKSLNKLTNNIDYLSFFNQINQQYYFNHLTCFIYSFFSDCFDIEKKKIVVSSEGYIIDDGGTEVNLCTDIHKTDPAITFVFEQFFQKNRRTIMADRISVTNRYNILIYKNMELDSINIEECGWEKRLPNQSFSTITKNWYSLHIICKGLGRIVHDGMVEKFGKGDMFILKPKHAYQYISDENDPCEYYWICMSGQSLKLYLDNALITESHKTHVIKDASNTNKIIDYIKSIISSHEDEESFILHSKEKMYGILAMIADNCVISEEINIVNSIKEYINENFTRGINVNDVCEYFTYDRTYLFRMFKESTRMSIGEYISKCKKDALINYLENTNLTLDKICVKTGFTSKTSLITFCYKEFGITPSEYRKQHNVTK